MRTIVIVIVGVESCTISSRGIVSTGMVFSLCNWVEDGGHFVRDLHVCIRLSNKVRHVARRLFDHGFCDGFTLPKLVTVPRGGVTLAAICDKRPRKIKHNAVHCYSVGGARGCGAHGSKPQRWGGKARGVNGGECRRDAPAQNRTQDHGHKDGGQVGKRVDLRSRVNGARLGAGK